MLGTLIAAVLYIVSTSVIGGILPGHELASSNAPFGLVFAHMFNPTIGKIVIAMMVISCFGSLFSWQFTLAEVARSSAVVGYFPKLFGQVSKAGAPILGICVITAAQTAISFMTVSPSLDKQFTVVPDARYAVLARRYRHAVVVATLDATSRLAARRVVRHAACQ